MRKLTSLFAALIIALHLTACTSGDSRDDESADGAVAESTEGTDGDLANLDAPPADSAVASTDGANEGFLDEQLPEDALGESNKVAQEEAPPVDLAENTTPPPAEEPPKEEVAATEPAPIETPVDTSVAAVDTGSPAAETPATTTTEAPVDTSAVASTSSTEPSLEPTPVAEAKPKASLKKIETAPFTRDGVLLNAVYVARSGDNYKKISQLIYGTDGKSKELKKLNPSVKPRVGDKIYYNSPTRSADDTKLLTYYEDAGMMPETYITKEGDDIKKLSKEWLGHKDSWKEVWATNAAIDSKDALPAGTELRYWKSVPIAAAPAVEAPKMDVAMNAPPEMAPPPEMEQPPQQAAMPEMPPPPPAAEMMPPPPPQPVAEMPPPPPAEMAPPPPPPAEMAPPPPPPMEAVNPPPPPPVAKKAPPAGEVGGMDNDMVMTLAGAGIIALGLAAMIIVRKRRQNREMASAFNDTQVGT